MEQLEQLKMMLSDAQDRLKQNPDFKLVQSLESLITDLETAFGPIEASPKEAVTEAVEAAPETVEEVAVETVEADSIQFLEDSNSETKETPVEVVAEQTNEKASVETVEVVTEQVNEVPSVEKTTDTSEVVKLHAEETTFETVSEPINETSESVIEDVSEDIVEALNAMPEVSVDVIAKPEIVKEVKRDIDPAQSDVLESNLEDALNEMIEASSDSSEKDPLEKNNPFSSMAISATNGSASSVN
ncbi:MAG: hypothetical protein QM488_09545 [Rhizobiaceae bacterium]